MNHPAEHPVTGARAAAELRKLAHALDVPTERVAMFADLPPDDLPRVQDHGVAEVFGPGTPTSRIVDFVREQCVAQ